MSFITKENATKLLRLPVSEWRSVTMKIRWAVNKHLPFVQASEVVQEYLAYLPTVEQWDEFYTKLSALRRKTYPYVSKSERRKEYKRNYQRQYMRQYRERKRETKKRGDEDDGQHSSPTTHT